MAFPRLTRLRIATAALVSTLLVATFYVAFAPHASAATSCKEIGRRYHVYMRPAVGSVGGATIGQATLKADICTNGTSLVPSVSSLSSQTYWYWGVNGWSVWDGGAHRSYFNGGGFSYGSEYFYGHVMAQSCVAHYGWPCSYTSDDAIHLKLIMLNGLIRYPQIAGDFVLGGRVMRPYWSTTCNDNNYCRMKLY